MRLLRRLAHLWRLRVHGAELEEELSFHREKIRQDLIEQGLPAADAEAAARRAMGNTTRMREASRGVWLWPSLEAMVQDAKVTLRSLRASPAFTTGVMLTFALGVGANAAMFSLIDRLMFRPPPLMRGPASVHRVHLYRMRDGVERETGGQYPRHADLVRFTTSFSDIAAHSLRRLAVGVGQEAREMPIGVVSAAFFTFFDAPPVAGRYFGPVDDSPQAREPVAVLSYPTWQARYAGRADAIGTSLHIGSAVYTIIGVAPKEFVGLWPLTPPAAFIPVAAYAASTIGGDWPTNYGSAFGLATIVRRRPGVTIEAASADLSQALRASYVAQGSADRLAELRPRALAGSILPDRGPERSSVAKVALWLAGVTTYRAAHRLRERGEPHARPRPCPASRDRAPAGTGREPEAAALAALHREPAARRGGEPAGPRRRDVDGRAPRRVVPPRHPGWRRSPPTREHWRTWAW
jgi:hypothetical protein